MRGNGGTVGVRGSGGTVDMRGSGGTGEMRGSGGTVDMRGSGGTGEMRTFGTGDVRSSAQSGASMATGAGSIEHNEQYHWTPPAIRKEKSSSSRRGASAGAVREFNLTHDVKSNLSIECCFLSNMYKYK